MELSSIDSNEWRSLFHNAANTARMHAMSLQHCERVGRRLWRNCNEQAAGCLRIEKQILKFRCDVFGKCSAVAYKCAVIFQAGGKMTVSRAIDRSRKVFERGMIDFKRNGIDVVREDRRAPFLARGRAN